VQLSKVFGCKLVNRISRFRKDDDVSFRLVWKHFCAMKNSKSHFSPLNRLEHQQLQLDKFSEHEIAFIFH